MNPTLEVKTKVEVDKTMKLIDMNGKKISFRSDCFVKPNNPNDKFYIAIVNQNDLDSGNIKFEVLDKEYKRRITYESQDGEHLNHYVAMKKMPNSTTEAPILCDVVVRLTEIEPEPLYSKIEYKEDLNSKLHELSNLEEYKENEEENEEEDNEDKEDKEDKEENKNETFNYRNVGIFCIIIFVLYILIRKQ